MNFTIVKDYTGIKAIFPKIKLTADSQMLQAWNKWPLRLTISYYKNFNHKIFLLTLRRPLRKKLRMRWFFDVSKVKQSSFLKSDLTDPPPQIFDAHLLENTKIYFM